MAKQRLMVVDEVAEFLGLSVGAVHKMVQRGRLKPYKVGRRLKFSQEQVDEYLAGTVIDNSEG